MTLCIVPTHQRPCRSQRPSLNRCPGIRVGGVGDGRPQDAACVDRTPRCAPGSATSRRPSSHRRSIRPDRAWSTCRCCPVACSQAPQRRPPDVDPPQRLRGLVPERTLAEDVGLLADARQCGHGRNEKPSRSPRRDSPRRSDARYWNFGKRAFAPARRPQRARWPPGKPSLRRRFGTMHPGARSPSGAFARGEGSIAEILIPGPRWRP